MGTNGAMALGPTTSILYLKGGLQTLLYSFSSSASRSPVQRRVFAQLKVAKKYKAKTNENSNTTKSIAVLIGFLDTETISLIDTIMIIDFPTQGWRVNNVHFCFLKPLPN